MADLRAMVTETQQSKADFAQQKQAQREALFQRRDTSIVDLTTDPAAYRAYLDLQAANPAVSPGNLALVWAENPAAAMVCTMNRWNSLGRNVTKGESGIKVIVPQKYRDGRGILRTGYDVGRVFDVSQTHGARLKPPIRLVDGTPEMEKAIRALVSSSPVPIEPLDGFVDGSFYDSHDKKILIDAALPDGAQLAALTTEIAHARLHAAYQGEYSRDLCSTDAESVGYLVCKRFGVAAEPPAADNLDALYGAMPTDDRRAALEYNQDLSKFLMDRVEKELSPPREHGDKAREEQTK